MNYETLIKTLTSYGYEFKPAQANEQVHLAGPVDRPLIQIFRLYHGNTGISQNFGYVHFITHPTDSANFVWSHLKGVSSEGKPSYGNDDFCSIDRLVAVNLVPAFAGNLTIAQMHKMLKTE